MRRVVTATYQNGIFTPDDAVPLEEQQQVLLIVVPLTEQPQRAPVDEGRVAAMQEQVNSWLAQQPANTAPQVAQLTAEQDEMVIRDFEMALAEIRMHTQSMDEAEIAADVESAIAELTHLTPLARARLVEEVNVALTDWATHVR